MRKFCLLKSVNKKYEGVKSTINDVSVYFYYYREWKRISSSTLYELHNMRERGATKSAEEELHRFVL